MQMQTADVITQKTLNGPEDVIVVEPLLYLNGQVLPLEAVCMYTVISQKLGPTDRWLDVLQTAARQHFNVIHFTPVQVNRFSTTC